MKRFISTLGVFLACLLIFQNLSAQWGGIKGNGKVVTQNRELKPFTEVSVASGMNVILRQGKKQDVVVESDENLLEAILTEVQGDMLKVYIKKSIRKAEKMNVYITIPILKGVYTSSGADFLSKGLIKGDFIKLEASSGSDMKIDVEMQSVKIDASSGSDIEVRGKTNEAKISASSGSDVDASVLVAKKGVINASSAADVDVHVTEEIRVDASSGSDVNITGNPPKWDIDSSSGADVKRR